MASSTEVPKTLTMEGPTLNLRGQWNSLKAYLDRGPPEEIRQIDISLPGTFSTLVDVIELIRQKAICSISVKGNSSGLYVLTVKTKAEQLRSVIDTLEANTV